MCLLESLFKLWFFFFKCGIFKLSRRSNNFDFRSKRGRNNHPLQKNLENRSCASVSCWTWKRMRNSWTLKIPSSANRRWDHPMAVMKRQSSNLIWNSVSALFWDWTFITNLNHRKTLLGRLPSGRKSLPSNWKRFSLTFITRRLCLASTATRLKMSRFIPSIICTPISIRSSSSKRPISRIFQVIKSLCLLNSIISKKKNGSARSLCVDSIKL